MLMYIDSIMYEGGYTIENRVSNAFYGAEKFT